jgi:hypothetical protein
MKLNRRRLILGLYVIALIVVTELVTGRLELPAWPAYVAWVLFFGEHMNPMRTPHILIGATIVVGRIIGIPETVEAAH